MRYHYFTLEQRDALARQIHANFHEGRQPELDSALTRLRSPDYGVCEECSGDIPFVRLLSDPLARRCRSCRPG